MNESKLNLGTILHGSLITAPNKQLDFFIIEDLIMHNGANLRKIVFGEKFEFA